MEEKVFFEKGNVSVSNSRFMVDGQTYAMNNVTSVKAGVKKADRSGAVLFCIIGLGCLFGSGYVFWLGIILIVIGVIAFKGAKDEYTVVLNTSAGENQALISKDKFHIESVITALNDAIVSRG
ncbi:DUF6232 family protein [Sulfurovum sp.]|uniref:DUF6232 family protein n=1 Tax=Sulfurovum sp. TaxID=1969726 RepID=UPI003569580C